MSFTFAHKPSPRRRESPRRSRASRTTLAAVIYLAVSVNRIRQGRRRPRGRQEDYRRRRTADENKHRKTAGKQQQRRTKTKPTEKTTKNCRQRRRLQKKLRNTREQCEWGGAWKATQQLPATFEATWPVTEQECTTYGLHDFAIKLSSTQTFNNQTAVTRACRGQGLPRAMYDQGRDQYNFIHVVAQAITNTPKVTKQKR